MMEHDRGCSMDTICELSESRLCKWIGVKFLGEWGDGEMKNIYDVGLSEGGRTFGERMKLSF